MIKEKLIDSIFYNQIKDSLKVSSLSPNRDETYMVSSIIIEKIMSLDPNKIGYNNIISASVYTKNTDTIMSLFSSLNGISSTFTDEYVIVSKKYSQLYAKMKACLEDYRKKIDILLDRYCLTIDNSYGNELAESRCGHFGSYLTLPYFINTTATYNGNAIFYVMSDGQVTYNNFGSISSLQFTDKPSFKVLSQNNKINTNIKVVVANDMYNGIYLNIPSDKIIKTIVKLQTETGLIVKEFDSGEIFFTFEKAKFSVIDITVISNNYNPGKPYSMAISDFILLKNIEFMSYGVFKSKAINMESIRNIDSLTMTSIDANKATDTNMIQSLSISNNSNLLSYNKVDSDKYLDMSSYYLNKSKDIILSDALDPLNIDYGDSANGFTLLRIPFESDSELWDMQYAKANIIVGINSDLMDPTQDNEIKYRNWVKDNNYYETYLFNPSDPITINIGSKSFTLNQKDVTGNVLIPSGMSKIRVMEKDINLNVDIANHSQVINETLYLNNFMYLFTGLPEFNGDGAVQKEQKFSIKGQSIFYLQEQFVASGLIVTDNNGIPYRLHMSRNASMPGTYTIEPNKGIVKVFPLDGVKTVSIKYYKSSQLVPPVGILFSSLLTFAPITSLLDISNSKSTFSIDGKYDEKVLYVPRESDVPAKAQILYNNANEPIFLSTMIEMQTANKYVSPAIRSLTLSMK